MKPGGPHARRAAAKRSYPTSEVRGSGQECQAATAREWPRRATQVRGQGRRLRGATQDRGQGRRLGGATQDHASGSCQEELPHVRGQGWRPGGPTPRPTSGGCEGTGGPRVFVTTWTLAHQPPLSMGFSRQEYWSGLPFPSPVDHIVLDLSTMTRSSWVAPQAWLSFIELDKAVVLV